MIVTMNKLSMQLTPTEPDPDIPEDPYDFTLSEDVYFEVIRSGLPRPYRKSWSGWDIWDIQIGDAYTRDGKPYEGDQFGPVSYECCEAGLFDYTLMDQITCPRKPGVYKVEQMEASYSTDYYGETDVDYYGGFTRPATYWEIRKHMGFSRWHAFWTVLWMGLGWVKPDCETPPPGHAW